MFRAVAASPAGETLVDPRGLRFVAGITAAVLAAVLLIGSGWLLAVQALVFGAAAFGGLRRSPYGLLYRTLVAPRLRPPAQREPAAAPRFAQAVGLGFAVVGVVGYASGFGWLGFTATALAWVAAFLNAAFGFCLGCEMYVLIRRVSSIRKGVPA